MLRSSTVKTTTEKDGKIFHQSIAHRKLISALGKLTSTTGTTAVSGWYPKVNTQVAVVVTVRSVERVKADYRRQHYLLDSTVEHLVIRRVNYWFAAKQTEEKN